MYFFSLTLIARVHIHPKNGQVNFFLIIGVISGLILCIACAVLVIYLWTRKLRYSITSYTFSNRHVKLCNKI